MKKDSKPEGDLPPNHSGYQEGRQPQLAASGKQGSRTLSQGLPEGLRMGSPNLKGNHSILLRRIDKKRENGEEVWSADDCDYERDVSFSSL